MTRPQLFSCLLLVIAGCTLGSLWAWAQPPVEALPASLEVLSTRTRDFLQDVSLGKVSDAYGRLLEGSSLAGETQSLAELVQKTGELEPRYGRCWSFERLSARPLGSDVVVLNFLYKCQRLPLVWRVVWYRTPGGNGNSTVSENWQVISIRFDTDWDRAIESPR